MDAKAARGVLPKTWNDSLKLLRATFKHLRPRLTDGIESFHGLATKATETVNREPFTVEELKAITEACAQDDLRPNAAAGITGDPMTIWGECSASESTCVFDRVSNSRQNRADAKETGV